MQSDPGTQLTRKNMVFLALLAVLGIGLVLISTHRFGVVIWPDSVYYLSTARNLNSGAGFVSFDGQPLTLWPPLYPALLALTSRLLGTDPLQVAGAINALFFGILVYLAGVMLFRYLSSSPLLAIVGSLAFLFAIPLFSLAVIAYSEPLFILLVLISFIFLGNYWSMRSPTSLVLFAVSVSLSFLTRYTGIILVLWGALLIILFDRDSLKKRITLLTVFGLISCLPTGIWLLRNLLVAHNLFGPRTPPAFPFAQIVSYGFNNVLSWYLPPAVSAHPLIVLILGVLVLALISFSLKLGWHSIRESLKRADPALMVSIACGLFILLYAGFLVLSATNTYVSVFESRLWAPIFIPLTLLLFLFARFQTKQFGKFLHGKWVNFIVVALAAIWLIYPIISTVRYAYSLVQYGDGIAGVAWSHNQTVQYIHDHPSGCTFYSNGPDVIYFLTGVHAQWVPSREDPTTDFASQKGIWPAETPACLVWFDDIYRTSLFRPDEILPVTNLEQVIRLGDGEIYLLTRK